MKFFRSFVWENDKKINKDYGLHNIKIHETLVLQTKNEVLHRKKNKIICVKKLNEFNRGRRKRLFNKIV